MIHQMTPPIRYSPRPLSEYVTASGQGPANDPRLSHPEVWNLAYLSHDYEKSLLHRDPAFLTHVRRTCQFDMTKHRVDLTFGASDCNDLLASRLLMPAPWFVHWLLKNRKVMLQLPLFVAYGQAWLATVESRARICHTHEDEEPEQPLGDLTDARGLLLQFQRR